jgi:hypothetical protein
MRLLEESAGAGTVVVSMAAEQETSVLACMIAECEFSLCARNYLPKSEVETLSMLETFSKRKVLATSIGFFDRLANEACLHTSTPHVYMRALSYELECRRRSPDVVVQIPNVAQCFRRLVDMCLDNHRKIQWFEDALQYAQKVASGETGSGGGGGGDGGTRGDQTRTAASYPADELRWLMATSWNSGLSCVKVGDRKCGEKYLGVAVRLGQMSVGGESSRKIATDEEMESMVGYYSDQEFAVAGHSAATTVAAANNKRKR